MLRSLGRIAGVMVAALAVSGCATAYRAEAAATWWDGGGTRHQGPGPLVRVAFYGNGYTPADRVARYVVFRAAEDAHARGKPYFILYPTLIHAAMNQPADKPTLGSIGGRASATAYMLPLDAQEPGALETAAILEELAAEEGAPATRVNGKDRR